MARKGLVNYSKQRDASTGQDGWARLKDWKDPMGGNARYNNPLAGNNTLRDSQTGRFKSMKSVKGYGYDLIDNRRDSTYGNQNDPSDSTA